MTAASNIGVKHSVIHFEIVGRDSAALGTEGYQGHVTWYVRVDN
jgi:hypothetical protein